MRHIGALLLKFIVISLVLELVLLNVTELAFGSIIVIALSVTIIAYLIGDLAILSKSNNTIATVADIGLALITILAFNYIFDEPVISFWDAFLASLIIGVTEWVFHKYVWRSVLHDEK